MASSQGAWSLQALIAELYHTGGITITTPDQRELAEGRELLFVTLIQIDGNIVNHVSAKLMADPAALAERLREHRARVNEALAPIGALMRRSIAFQRLASAALLVAPQLGWIVHAVQQPHGDFESRQSLVLFAIGVIGVPFWYWLRRYAARVFNWGVRLAAGRLWSWAAPAVFSVRRG